MLIAPTSLLAAPPQPSTLALDEVIGETAADAAVVLARALREFQNDGLSARTRGHWSDLIARLFELWQAGADRIDVYAMARARGTCLLQERYGKDLDTSTIAVLVGAVVEALRHVVRTELN